MSRITPGHQLPSTNPDLLILLKSLFGRWFRRGLLQVDVHRSARAWLASSGHELQGLQRAGAHITEGWRGSSSLLDQKASWTSFVAACQAHKQCDDPVPVYIMVDPRHLVMLLNVLTLTIAIDAIVQPQPGFMLTLTLPITPDCT